MITLQNAQSSMVRTWTYVKANIVIEDNEIVEVGKKRLKGKKIDAKGCIVAPSLH